MNFKVESWSVIPTAFQKEENWQEYVANFPLKDNFKYDVDLNGIPVMLRRRFSKLGKSAVSSLLQVIDFDDKIPTVFASRHGDLVRVLSLLKDIGSNQPLSPTQFSLAVHNAVSGLASIVRKDTSATTAIAASEGLVIKAIFEAIGQLQTYKHILCVIYDAPLPEPFQPYCESAPFPWAIAMIISSAVGQTYTIKSVEELSEKIGRIMKVNELKNKYNYDIEFIKIIGLLLGTLQQIDISADNQVWRIASF